jgi:hypothetical protein
MLTHTVPIDDDTELSIAASKSGAAGVSLTLFKHGIGQASVYLPSHEQAHLLLASLIDATRHMDWLSEKQAMAMVAALQKK